MLYVALNIYNCLLCPIFAFNVLTMFVQILQVKKTPIWIKQAEDKNYTTQNQTINQLNQITNAIHRQFSAPAVVIEENGKKVSIHNFFQDNYSLLSCQQK